ncbi:hypothetical protein MCI89_08435 [Muricomes sp. OA1]|uniref:Uncharacterized protein n=2 Tax=Lachnospiraceae TaxID=186803 RepID=A0A3E2WMS0_9FIRM|nr:MULTISPECIES: hypothetical protein [Clostridia]MCH1972374.1 hypothetical protein [Muricomes sp. OA1]MEE0199970.1 hypothetical protein [Muricomes sp.]RGC28366.1 hypothetical protein DWX41_16710 [Hungatella hathewayi]GKH35086.1 hypothetical protein CE91St64_44930 [Faecalicatena contorta]
MQKFLEYMSEPQNIMWIIIVIILIISKFGIGLNYISVNEIVKNHLYCFRNKDGKLLIIPVINYICIPFLMGGATAVVKKIDSNTINVITIIISILTAMLFTMLTMVIDMKAKIKKDPEYFSTEAQISKTALLETYYTIMFEILISVILLILCFFNCFTRAYGNVQSFLIYSLTYMLIINLLMVIKRIFRVIDTNMRK